MTFYDFAKRIFRFLFRLMGWKMEGVENLPVEGPVILAINHVSFWDPIVAACSLTRPVSFMAKEDLFSIPVLGRIFLRLGAFPVKRGQGDIFDVLQKDRDLKRGACIRGFPRGNTLKDWDNPKGSAGNGSINGEK